MCPWVHARATFAGFNAGHSLTSILHGASAASLTRVVVFDLNYHMYLFVLVALRIAIVACCLPILPVASCIVVFDPDLSHPACSVQQAVRVHMYRSPCSIVVSANRIRSDPIRSDPIRSDPIRSDRRYTPHCLQLVRQLYPTMTYPPIEFYAGASQQSVLAFFSAEHNLGEKFDVIHVDGGHTFWQVTVRPVPPFRWRIPVANAYR